jgi:hypothetical protein
MQGKRAEEAVMISLTTRSEKTNANQKMARAQLALVA